MKKLVTVRNLNYLDILKNINLDIETGSLIAISGPNNCGKTTLIKLLSGLLPEEQSIFFEKKLLSDRSQIKRKESIGFIIPSMEVPFTFDSIEEEMLFALGSLEKENKKKRYKDIMALLKLRAGRKNSTSTLTPFLKTKLLLALVLAKKPQIIYLDDICAELTREEAKEILTILKTINQKEHITIVMTTSNLEEVVDLDMLYILEQGEILLQGKPLEVLKEDSMLAKMGLTLPFMVDLSLKLKYYDLLEKVELDMDGLVNTLWK